MTISPALQHLWEHSRPKRNVWVYSRHPHACWMPGSHLSIQYALQKTNVIQLSFKRVSSQELVVLGLVVLLISYVMLEKPHRPFTLGLVQSPKRELDEISLKSSSSFPTWEFHLNEEFQERKCSQCFLPGKLQKWSGWKKGFTLPSWLSPVNVTELPTNSK